MGKVILSKVIKYKLLKLSKVLYNKNYFGCQSGADAYVQQIRDFILTIPNKLPKICNKSTYGKYYARYDVPKSDMKYYITFNKFENDYLIKNIISPKTKAYLAVFGK